MGRVGLVATPPHPVLSIKTTPRGQPMIQFILAGLKIKNSFSPGAVAHINEVIGGRADKMISNYMRLSDNFVVGKPVDLDDVVARLKDYRTAFAALFQASIEMADLAENAESAIYFWENSAGTGFEYQRFFTEEGLAYSSNKGFRYDDD